MASVWPKISIYLGCPKFYEKQLILILRFIDQGELPKINICRPFQTASKSCHLHNGLTVNICHETLQPRAFWCKFSTHAFANEGFRKDQAWWVFVCKKNVIKDPKLTKSVKKLTSPRYLYKVHFKYCRLKFKPQFNAWFHRGLVRNFNPQVPLFTNDLKILWKPGISFD